MKTKALGDDGRARWYASWMQACLALTVLWPLSGCGMGTPSSSTLHSLTLQGKVMGGSQPITGASIQLYAMGTEGDGSASTPLLSQAVSTTAAGGFSITGLYTCPSSSTPVYVVASGGNPGYTGGSANTAISLMSVLGACGNLSGSSKVVIDEVTTVASIWPLASFMSSISSIGSSPLNASALQAAVQTVTALVDPGTGTSPGPTLSAGSTVPISKLYTLADILSTCVNSQGGTAGDGSPCGNLFSAATVGGRPAPTDVASAALAIANNPTWDVTALFYLVPVVVDFAPTLTATPADWTLSVTASSSAAYTYYVDNVGGSDSNNGTSATTPFATIAKVNSLLLFPGQSVAFKSGDVWHEMLQVSASGGPGAPITYTSYGSGVQPVIDASNNATGWKQSSAKMWALTQAANPLLISFAGQAGTPVGSASAITAPNQYYWSGSTLYVYATADPTSTLEIAARPSALTSAGASFVTVSGLELRGGIYTAYCGAAVACSYWDFEGDTFDSAYSDLLEWQFNNGVQTYGLTINNNIFRGAGSAGIALSNGGYAMGATLTNNTMTDLCKIYVAGSSSNSYCDAINLFSQTGFDGGGYIAYNTINGVGLTSGAAYGGGIHPDTVVNWDIEHNTVMNTNYSGLMLEKGSGSTARYNLLVNTGQYNFFAGLQVRAGDGLSVSNQLVEYNTSVGGYYGCAVSVDQNQGAVTASRITFGMNICDGAVTGTQLYLDPGYDAAGNTYPSNCLGIAGPNFVMAAGSPMSSYSSLPAVITMAVQGDPEFVNPAISNYNLQTGSPAAAIGAFPAP